MSSFLFSPELTAPPLTPARSQDDSSGSSIASDYSNADVNTINDLLLTLGQTIEGSTPNHNESYGLDLSSCQPQQFNHPALPDYHGSMYPSLPTADRSSTSFAAPRVAQHHSLYTHGGEYSPLATARHTKPVAAPSIVNDHRLPTYTSVGRLNRAAPISSFRTDIKGDTMDVDAEEQAGRKVYSSSIRSTSLDVQTSPSVGGDSNPTLAPILPVSRANVEKPRLPSIASLTSAPSSPASSSPRSNVTLPSIRDMLADAPGPVSSPMSDSSSTTSTSSSRTIYPSFPTSSSRSTSNSHTPEPARPQSSGGVERLTHRVHKLDMRAGDSTTSSSVVASDNIEESDEDENDDHPSHSKKSRVESPEPMAVGEGEEEVQEGEKGPTTTEEQRRREAVIKAHEELKQRRLAVIQNLIIMVNANYRAKVAAEAAAAGEQPKALPSAPTVPVAV